MPSDHALAQTTPASYAGRLTQLIQQIKSIATGSTERHAAQRDAFFVFFVRAASAGVLYLGQIVLARLMGAAEYGIYVWVWTLVLVLGGLSHLGVGAALARMIPAYRDSGQMDLLRGLLIGSRWLAIFSGSVVSLVAYLILRTFTDGLHDSYVVPAALGVVCIGLYAISDVQDALGRAQGWLSVALVPPYILRPVVLLVSMAVAQSIGLPMDAITAAMGAIIACWAAAMLQTLMVQQRIDMEIPKGPRAYAFGTWIKASFPLLMIYGAELALQNAGLLVLSAYASPETLGMYFAAAKTMSLAVFIHHAVGSVVAKDFAALYAGGDRAALAACARSAVNWTFWPSLAAAVGVLALGQPLLWLFSADFVEAYPVMLILAAGFLFRAVVGPAEYILSAIGEQKLGLGVAASIAIIDIALCFALIPELGMTGAAMATATAMAVGSVLYAGIVRRKVGLDISIVGAWARTR